MAVKACKFGGSSLADADQQKKVKSIIESDRDRRYIVPSAPGKRHKDDQKITDLLYLCHAHAQQGLSFDEVYALIVDRYWRIVADLGIEIDLAPHLERIKQDITAGESADYAASRGEFLNAQIIAKLIDFPFVDAGEIIFFDKRGTLDVQRTQEAIADRLGTTECAVIPGFYGTDVNGKVKTFSRGGSDITGALVARGVHASAYENWTDVSGLLMGDPRIIDNPRPIAELTYRELRELAYMGATVLHDEAIFPVRAAGIPVNVRNTNAPDEPGTMILPNDALPSRTDDISITGIAGRKDFTVIALEKSLMNSELGFGRRLLGVLETNSISYEHCPSGIDTMSVVVSDDSLEDKLDRVTEEIQRVCQPDTIDVYPHMALIATVGRGMAHTPGTAARLFTGLARAGVNIRMIDQGSSEINIIVGVETADFEKAIRAIYEAFVHA